jgi:hypothetical protein
MGRFLSIVLPHEDRSGFRCRGNIPRPQHCVPVTRDRADQAELKWNHIRLGEVSGRVVIWSKFELVEVVLW